MIPATLSRCAALLALAAAAAGIAGCASTRDRVVFVTKTSVGVDFESTPASGSIAYDRVEGFYGYRFQDGTVPPVAASLFTNGGLLNRQIKQVYATGNAARIVSGSAAAAQPQEDYSGAKERLFFGTSSVVGLRIGFSSGVDSLTLGYKRKEASTIPVVVAGAGGAAKPAFPSVLGSFDTDAAATTPSGTQLGIRQYFATGTAAEAVAGYPAVKALFEQEARDALAQYRDSERLQSAAVLETLNCLAELPDPKLSEVWRNAEEVGLFPDQRVYAALRARQGQAARSFYTRYLTTIDAGSQVHTGLLIGHRAYVCNLRG